ncbi:MAG: amidohydrolase family protein [Bacteroidia bacterium]|nr:amidohydrolase family protein [Bacteroidia bacterium]
MGNHRYDAHCHIFTLKYAVKEIKNMLHDMLCGTYPFHDPTSKALFAARENWFDDLKQLLRQLYELIHAAGGSEEENLNFLQEEAIKAFPSGDLRIIPLMMDIFYMLAYPLYKDGDIQKVRGLKMAQVDEKEYQDRWNEILDDFKTYVQLQKLALKATAKGEVGGNVEQALQIIEEERHVAETLRLKSGALKSTGFEGFYQTGGFCYHLNNLVDLVIKRKGELYPFVAIDPRRPGIIDTLVSGSFFKGDGRFYGVKLYPRMGFHPQSKPMDAVYKYCNDNHLPIIFHCGMGGFPPSTTWKYFDFGNPLNFEPVVKKYPKLKIDFAHLGSSDPSYDWAKTIVRLINENDNVYSDLACYTSTDELKPMKKLWDANPKLKSRLMFGTDFDVMYFTGKVNMQIYYKNFKTIFKPDELKLLMCDNPVKFMGINA